MRSLRRFLIAMRSHQAWAWLGVFVYACAVTFPHQVVQDVVAQIANRVTLKRVYQFSATIALIEAIVVMFLFFWSLRGQKNRRWLMTFWLLSFALIVGTWRVLTANNTELVHYPQYFPEGIALLALTLSPAESLAWIVLFGGLDEAFQYTFLVKGLPLPYDFNDVYMDLLGGAVGVIFAMAVLGCERETAPRIRVGSILRKPGIVVILGIIVTGIVLWASGKMLLYEAPGSPSHWFSLSRLKTKGFWYFNQHFLGPNRIHELLPAEGTILILTTIALYGVLDRTFEISMAPSTRAQGELARTEK
jgi:hypothetical protein